jgi:putative ABC transport system ATP-binding protein
VNINDTLNFENVSKFYEKGGLKNEVLVDVSFKLEPGTITLINGPSGSGKTTIIYLSALIKKPDSGEIKIIGKKTSSLNEKERSKLIRENIGIIYQRSNLIPNLTTLENVMLPMLNPDKDKAQNLLEKVDIKDFNRYPGDLSFEDEQKVTLARSLVNDPAIILADEPAATLNSDSTKIFMNHLNDLDNVAVLITSDNNLISKYSDRTMELKEGIIRN